MAETKNGKADFLAKSKQYKKQFKEKRTIDAGGSFEQPVMEDGAYNARLTSVRFGTDKNEVPYVSLSFVVVDGDNKGDRPSIYHGLRNDESIEYLIKDCKRLGIETDDMEFEEMVEALEELATEKPYVKIDVKNKEYKNPKTKKKENRLNVYVGKLLENYDPDSEDDDNEGEEEGEEETTQSSGKKDSRTKSGSQSKTSAADEDDSGDEDDEDEGDDDEGDDEDEIEDSPPEKGDVVLYKPKGARAKREFTVVKVNLKAETVNLKDDDGKTANDVPFSAIEFVTEDDD